MFFLVSLSVYPSSSLTLSLYHCVYACVCVREREIWEVNRREKGDSLVGRKVDSIFSTLFISFSLMTSVSVSLIHASVTEC